MFVALPADDEVELPILEILLNGITVVGLDRAGNAHGPPTGLRIARRRPYRRHSSDPPSRRVNEAIASVEAGRGAARVVLKP